MRQYFEKMDDFGKALKEGEIKRSEENVKQIKQVEAGIDELVDKAKKAGMSEADINETRRDDCMAAA